MGLLKRILMFVIALGVVSGIAQAAPDDRAREAYEMGRRAYNLAQYDEAAGKFEESYRLSGDAVLLFNLAQCYRHAGRLQEALSSYRSYLRESPDAENRALVEARVSQLEGDLSENSQPPRSSPRADKMPEAALAPTAEKDLVNPYGVQDHHGASSKVAPPETTVKHVPSISKIAPNASPIATPVNDSESAGLHDEPRSFVSSWMFWSGVGVVAGVVVTLLMLPSSGDDIDCQGIKPCGTLQ